MSSSRSKTPAVKLKDKSVVTQEGRDSLSSPYPNNSPIFILSSERSGSTLLRYIMDSHPEICSPGQLYLGALSDALSTTIYYSLAQLPVFESEQDSESFVMIEVRKIIDELMGRYAEGKKKNIWCDKTTMNLQQRDLLAKVFPEARYLCLYRQCLDVVHSCIKFSPLGFMPELAPYIAREPSNFVAAMVESWVEKTESILKFEENNSELCFRVTYENLVGHPEETLTKIFEFLQLPWDKKILESVFSQPHDQGSGDLKVQFSTKIHSDSIGKGKDIPVISIPEYLIKRVNNLHQILNFEPIDNILESTSVTNKPIELTVAQGNKEGVFSFYDFLSTTLEVKHGLHSMSRSRCQFVIQGTPHQNCFIEISSGQTKIRSGTEKTIDCKISLTPSALQNLYERRISLIDAYEAGEISASGDLTMAIAIAKLVFTDEIGTRN